LRVAFRHRIGRFVVPAATTATASAPTSAAALSTFFAAFTGGAFAVAFGFAFVVADRAQNIAAEFGLFVALAVSRRRAFIGTSGGLAFEKTFAEAPLVVVLFGAARITSLRLNARLIIVVRGLVGAARCRLIFVEETFAETTVVLVVDRGGEDFAHARLGFGARSADDFDRLLFAARFQVQIVEIGKGVGIGRHRFRNVVVRRSAASASTAATTPAAASTAVISAAALAGSATAATAAASTASTSTVAAAIAKAAFTPASVAGAISAVAAIVVARLQRRSAADHHVFQRDVVAAESGNVELRLLHGGRRSFLAEAFRLWSWLIFVRSATSAPTASAASAASAISPSAFVAFATFGGHVADRSFVFRFLLVVASARRRDVHLGVNLIEPHVALEVHRVDVGDVEEAVAADAEVDERRLDRRLDVDDLALIDVADVPFVGVAFDVEFFQHAVFEDRDARFLRLQDVDEHFFLHAGAPCSFGGQ
jgi:hypothetical protein